jgi:uncharacterized protein
MYDSVFGSGRDLVLGALTGLIFGFLLQKGGVTRYRVLMGQFLLKDWTVAKIMGTAILVGGIGVYTMRALGMDVPLHVRPAMVWGSLLGGVIFGVGMAVLGYCPGTSVGAMGDGSRHAIFGVAGMIVGAAVYAESYAWFRDRVLQPANWGEITLSGLLDVPPLLVLAVLVVAGIGFFYALDRWIRPGARGSGATTAP